MTTKPDIRCEENVIFVDDLEYLPWDDQEKIREEQKLEETKQHD